MQFLALIVAFALSAPVSGLQGSAAAPVKVHKIPVGGEGGWDYLTVNPDARRLYVSRGDRVVVIDLDKETVVGELTGTPGVHGIAIVPELVSGGK